MIEKSLLKESFQKIAYTLRWTGIPLENKEGKLYKYYCWYIFNFIWMNTDLLGAMFWFLDAVKKGKSLTSLTYVAPCITISILADLKSLSMTICNAQVKTLILSLKELEEKKINYPQSKEKSNMIKSERDFLHLILKVLDFFNWTLIIAFPAMPLGLTLLNYIQTKEFNPLLPLLVVYPFNAFDIRVWPFIVVRQIWSVIIVILEVGGTDFVFFISSTYIRIQFQLLCFEVEGLIRDTDDPPKLAKDERFKQHFKDIVRWHQQLINSTDLLEVVYSKSTLYNFVSSSALICLTGFNVTAINDVAFVISFLSFLFMSMLQIYFLCFFGDMLMRASHRASDAVYNCKFYLTDKNTAKMLHILQLRAQKPCKLTACGFADVNLMAFRKILSNAWTFFALLKTVNGSPRG